MYRGKKKVYGKGQRLYVYIHSRLLQGWCGQSGVLTEHGFEELFHQFHFLDIIPE